MKTKLFVSFPLKSIHISYNYGTNGMCIKPKATNPINLNTTLGNDIDITTNLKQTC